MTTQGIIESLTGVIGESDTEIGGYHKTRLPVAATTSIPLSTTYTWNGTTTITTPDTSEVQPGDWIQLDSDEQFFEIDGLTVDTSITILNPDSLTIPTGSSPSSLARTQLLVETNIGWPESGILGIGGVKYTYSGTAGPQYFTGLRYVKGGRTFPGVAKFHAKESEVVDLSRARSAMDLLRRAMLVNYAEGKDLNTLGRNLGVLRNPLLGDDDVFREVIKAVAYNPRGTFYGLTLALDALLGEGNYELFEDFNAFPMTVFIRITGGPFFAEDESQGKTFMVGPEYSITTGGTGINISAAPITRGVVSSVKLKDEGRTFDCRVQYPSIDYLEEYPGDPTPTVWTYQGSGITEGTHVTHVGTVTSLAFFGTILTWNGTTTITTNATAGITAGTYVRLDSDGQWFEVIDVDTSALELTISNPYNLTIPSGATSSSKTSPADGAMEFTLVPPTDTNIYVHTNRVVAETDVAELRMLARVPIGSPADTGPHTGMLLSDDALSGIVIVESLVTGDYRVGFSNGLAVPTTYATIAKGTWADIMLRKIRDEWWEVWVDGNLIDRVPYSSGALLSTGYSGLGHFSTSAAGNQMQVKEISFFARNTRDYWNYNGDGDCDVNVANKNRITDSSSGFLSGDVGKKIEVLGSADAVRGAGLGDNNGVYEVTTFNGAGSVEVQGVTYADALIQNLTVGTARIVVPAKGQQFKYPQDLGKEIVISGSSLGNDGTYVITDLLDPLSLSSLDDGLTRVPSETNACVVSSGLVTEVDVDYRIDPNFVTESGIDFVLSDAGSRTGTALTVRDTFPLTGNHAVYALTFSQLLTAQLLQDEDVENEVTQASPLEFAYYPFYLNDPVGLVAAFIDDLTAAGVIPDTKLE